MPDRLGRLVAAIAVLFGVGAAVVGASVFFDAWQAGRAWAGTSGARQPAGQDDTPVWLDAPPAPSQAQAGTATPTPAPTGRATPVADAGADEADVQAHSRAAGNSISGPARAATVPGHAGRPPEAEVQASPTGDSGQTATMTSPGAAGEGSEPASGSAVSESAAAPRETVATPSATDLAVVESDFRFLEPPEPGAHARLLVRVAHHGPVASGPVVLAIPDAWLQHYSVLGTIPDVLIDRPGSDGTRHFLFGGPDPGGEQVLELHVIATGEESDAPEAQLRLQDNQEVARLHPRTVAPRPRPGPARAVTIPKLGVRAPVVPVPWEPPSFVVGQVASSAAVSLGNTVLIGHLTGPWGDVFAHLDRLRPGDEVVANSRGLEYRFVVSEIAVRPYDDLSPTLPMESPRLSMMTCTGQWNVFRQDYSHRLWVIAEPPELAERTIKANAERAAAAAREAEAAAAARATSEAERAASDATVEPTPAPPTQPSSAPVAPTIAVPTLAPVTAAPPRTQSPPDPEHEIRAAGISIEAPTAGAGVGQRLVVRGRATHGVDTSAPLWLFVRPELSGSRWFAVQRPLDVRPDGTWQTEIEIGGAAGIRHQIRVGPVSAPAAALLQRHAAERPGEPLDALPESFRLGAWVVVTRR